MKATQSKLSPLYPTEDATFWQHHVDAFKISGLSRKDYCRKHEINYDRFGYWLPKLISPKPSLLSPLVSVKLKEPASLQASVLCTLILTNGSELKIYDMQALACILEKWGQ